MMDTTQIAAKKMLIEAGVIEKPTFKLIKSSELTAQPKPHDWLIKDYLERGNVGLIFGEPENGKSLVTLEMGFCIATGIDWCNQSTKQGDVIYLAGEGFAGLGRRLKALEIKYETKADNLYLSEQPAQLIEQDNVVAIYDAVESLSPNPALVIVDTLHRNFGAGDENSSKDFGAMLSNVDNILKSPIGDP